MKRLLFVLVSLISFQAFSQNSNIESAAIYLRNGELEDAKKSIDAAVMNPESKDNPKAWFYFIAVYDTIYRNPAYASLIEPDLVDKFYDACKKCIETDVKNRYSYYCKDQAIINSAFMSFNKGISFYEQKDYKTALKYYQNVLDIMPYDKNEDLKKNNLSEKNIYLYMAFASIQSDNKAKAKIFLQKLMDLNYDDHLIYLQMVAIHLEEKDTATAVKFLDLGRQKYPTEKDLINQELNIYLNQGRRDVLVNKLNAALEINNEDITLLYVRGNVFDNFSSEFLKKYKHDRDTINSLKSRALTEKTPARKASYTNASNSFQASAESNLKKSREFVIKAEQDYKKVLELNADYIDAYFNLGAINNNRSTEIVEKMNAIPNGLSAAEFDKKYKPLKQQQDSILNTALDFFKQALSIAESKGEETPQKKKEKYVYMHDILFSMQQVYANLGDEKKTIETKKRRVQYEKMD